ncbi:AC transposase [Brachionus plicatilis]|uniref:AC transposase n=1 Tax=Brachionus plicatilis TaxID=10195 RepID=A0A3M7T9W8_BRAPC|nr:AC transposase [Brachionus plicatilis]
MDNRYVVPERQYLVNLSTDVLSITTDNAPNMVSGKEYLQADHTINSIIHMRCSAHILNLAVKYGLDCKEISQSISKIRYVNVSSKLEADLTAHQNACKEKELSVSLDIEIRWNSTFDMKDTAMKIFDSISKDLNDEKPEEIYS